MVLLSQHQLYNLKNTSGAVTSKRPDISIPIFTLCVRSRQQLVENHELRKRLIDYCVACLRLLARAVAKYRRHRKALEDAPRFKWLPGGVKRAKTTRTPRGQGVQTSKHGREYERPLGRYQRSQNDAFNLNKNDTNAIYGAIGVFSGKYKT